MKFLDSPVTAQEVADLMTMVVIETVAALAPNTRVADEKLEDIASNLLAMGNRLRDGDNKRIAGLVRATAQQLIQTESGAA